MKNLDKQTTQRFHTENKVKDNKKDKKIKYIENIKEDMFVIYLIKLVTSELYTIYNLNLL